MFLAAEEGPVASASGMAAPEATIGYVLAVSDVVDDLWEQHAAEVRRRCASSMPMGLIDRQ